MAVTGVAVWCCRWRGRPPCQPARGYSRVGVRVRVRVRVRARARARALSAEEAVQASLGEI